MIDRNVMEAIASLMDDEKREQVHAELAPCSNEEFLRRYVELDPEFENVLRSEFNVNLQEKVYYLRTDLRGCHEGDAVRVVGKIDDHIRVVINNKVIDVYEGVFPLFFSKTPTEVHDHDIVKNKPFSWIIHKRTK